jgi:hypothetical protein
MIYEDERGELVDIPVKEIQGEKTLQDGSTRFKFIGGPYHDLIFRVYPPYDVIRWPDGTTYEIHPPLNLKKSSKWVYVYTPPTENN